MTLTERKERINYEIYHKGYMDWRIVLPSGIEHPQRFGRKRDAETARDNLITGASK